MRVEGRTADEALPAYLAEIGRRPMLGREEEAVYARRAAGGDEAARRMLVEANLRFVVLVAKRYRNLGLPLSDLISEGNVGLLYAVDHFDPSRGCRFISYAVWWIRQAICRGLSEKSRLIRLPAHRCRELRRVEEHLESMSGCASRAARVSELARRAGMGEAELELLLARAAEPVSLDVPPAGTDDPTPLDQAIEDPRAESQEDAAMAGMLAEQIAELLEILSDKEADILTHRYGLRGVRPKSLQEIGGRYRLTKERVRQIEKRALRRLRAVAETERLREYLACS